MLQSSQVIMIELERGLAVNIDEEIIDVLHLAYGIYPKEFTADDLKAVHEIGKHIAEGGALHAIGQGGDMIALSRPDLNFVLKFAYDDQSPKGFSPKFSKRVEHGFSLGKENLGGILAPSMDIPLLSSEGESDNQVIYTAIVQEKVITVEHYLNSLESKARLKEEERLKKDFILITGAMWDRGIFDMDPSWEENYGVILVPRAPSIGLLDWGALYAKGQLVLIDIGHLSDNPEEFPEYEGIERQHLYEESLKSFFDPSNFKNRFGLLVNDDWMPTPGIVVPEP